MGLIPFGELSDGLEPMLLGSVAARTICMGSSPSYDHDYVGPASTRNSGRWGFDAGVIEENP